MRGKSSREKLNVLSSKSLNLGCYQTVLHTFRVATKRSCTHPFSKKKQTKKTDKENSYQDCPKACILIEFRSNKFRNQINDCVYQLSHTVYLSHLL